MCKRYGAYIAVIMMALLVVDAGAWAGEATGNEAVVTALIGSARVYDKGSKTGHVLKKGSPLRREQEVRVAEKSRLELRFPDGTVMRLAAGSHLKMSQVSFDRKRESKQVKVDLGIGKLWAKVKRLVTPDSSVEVETSNAVAGVRGTIYRVNVEEDKSAVVKVYDGSVYVANPPRDAAQHPGAAAQPHEVPGPHEVPPPYHEVSREQWTEIVKAMQQISISPQGVPSKPREFDPNADRDDWVIWNQERDKQLSF